MSRCAGSIRLDGAEINTLPTHKRAKAGVGYVPQGRGILPNFTVRENLMLGTFAAERRSSTIPDHIFELFPILKEFLSRRGGNLSGGQQQQLAIARALLSEPKILLLDEPTEGIQPNIVEQIEDVLIDLNRSKASRSCWSNRTSSSRGAHPTASRSSTAAPSRSATTSPP